MRASYPQEEAAEAPAVTSRQIIATGLAVAVAVAEPDTFTRQEVAVIMGTPGSTGRSSMAEPGATERSWMIRIEQGSAAEVAV